MATESNYIERHVNEVGNSQKSKEQYLSEGIAYDKAKQYQLALEACEQAIQLDCNYARAFHGKGLALAGLGRNAEVVKAYQQAIRLDPRNTRVYIDLGKVLYQLRQFEESGKAYRHAMQFDPNITQVYHDLTKALVDKADILYDRVKHDLFYGEAIVAYEQATLFNPDDANAYLQLGKAMYELGLYKESGKCI